MIRTIVTAVAFTVSVSVLAAAPAVAQSWNWGGGDEVAGSGKQTVRINATFKKGELIASFSDRRIYLITAPGQALSYPIAIPREQSRWQGVMSITDKRINPSWTPTPEMRRENPRLPSWVPGGHPMNPLGVRALYLGSSMYRIHGTDAPWTIGQPVSKGCIRMYNDDVLDLFERVPVGTKVTVTWQSFTTQPGSEKEPQVADSDKQQPAAKQQQRRSRVSQAAPRKADTAEN